MNRFLSIETSGDACSVSLIEPDRIQSLDTGEPRSHARLLAPLIKQLLDGADGPLDGICVDMGPGSYTGLRIGVSTAKGLAWSLQCPLYAASSLDMLAAATPLPEGGILEVRSMLPSRGEAVYSARYRVEAHACTRTDDIRFAPPTDLMQADPEGTVLVITDESGFPPDLIDRAHHRIPLHAALMAPLLRNQSAAYRVEHLATFEPLYVRSFVARKPSVSIFDRLPF